MLPLGDVDVAALSPLMRGMILALSYADTQAGIGLTATGAMNRKFVHVARSLPLARLHIRRPVQHE